MPRLPRLEYAHAIYHVITCSDGRRQLFHDLGHYDRIMRGLKDEVSRSSWKVLAFCWMPRHIHLLLQTPKPNLCRGMQHWFSGYANWYPKRNSRTGHFSRSRRHIKSMFKLGRAKWTIPSKKHGETGHRVPPRSSNARWLWRHRKTSRNASARVGD